MLVTGLALLTACESDRDSNPTVKAPTGEFRLYTPAMANATLDLANSNTIELVCAQQPNYGFPARTTYVVQMATKQDMSDMVELNEEHLSPKIEIDAALVASTLTTMKTDEGLDESAFPMNIPVYFRIRAFMSETSTNKPVPGTEVLSNVVSLNNVLLAYSLPPVLLPDNIYIVGNFNGWSWDTSLQMVQCYDGDNVFWHMVYIDESGIKFNTAKDWDGNQKGFNDITVSGDLASQISGNGDGNICSSQPGWYLMIATASVQGRNITYDVQFNKPEVWLIGVLTGGWDEFMGEPFTVPATADGDFVSPAFAVSVPGNDSDGCIRAYVKIPGFDWWKSEFMIFNQKIVYRGMGGDQDRVGGAAGQSLYLNFTKETGDIK